jgi:hypothetical protein
MTQDTGWFTSSYSGSGNETCVEVRIIRGHTVGVRDSTDPEGGAFLVTPHAWAAFLAHAKADHFTH